MSADTPDPGCRAEEGILFMCPPPNSPAPGTVFTGTLSEWRILCANRLVCLHCTYLVCTDGVTPLPQPPEGCNCNIIILNASVKTTLHKLTPLLVRKSAFSDGKQLLIYTDFWNSVMDGTLNTRERMKA